MKPLSCSIFFHNYYGRHDQWRDVFKSIPVSFNLYYNVVKESIYNISVSPTELEELFNPASIPMLNNAEIRFSSNKGKDIGGKMVLLDAYLQLDHQTDFIIFLHDKKSPYSTRGDAWRDKLFRIIEPPVMQTAFEILNKKDRVGIIAAKEFITCEYDCVNNKFRSVNDTLLQDLLLQYKIEEKEYNYVAGTMFLARSAPFQKFFLAHHPFAIRSMLEGGNIMDDEQPSYTHSWERILPWLVTSQGYSIMGL